ncbi:MAG: cellulase family glycosylhydrolase [bacterium]|jgi:hypothetical protein
MNRLVMLLYIALVCVQAVSSEPIQLHPDNPHYFLYQDKPTILITSGEHYGALLNLDFDYVTYFDTLQKDELNSTRVFSGAYCEEPGNFNIEKNTLAPKANKLITPWARSETAGYKNGGNKFDLTRWNDKYFERLKDFISQADKRGIIVEFVLFCPFYNDSMWELSPMNAINNVNGFSTLKREEVYTMKDHKLQQAQDAMVRKIVQELKGFDNVYYEICNEPYFGGVTLEWQKHIANVIVDAEAEFEHQHLIAQNIANGSEVIRDPNPDVSIFNFHYAYPPDAVAQNYHLNKVIGLNETGFRGDKDATYRGEAWAFIIAGGALFNNLDYSFTAEQEDGTARQKAPGGGSPALRQQLKILKDFIHGFDFINMKPAHELIRRVQPQRVKNWLLAEDGRAYAAYFREGSEVEAELKIPEGNYRVEWVNTITGNVDKSETVEHPGGNLAVQSPEYDGEIALRINRIDG